MRQVSTQTYGNLLSALTRFQYLDDFIFTAQGLTA